MGALPTAPSTLLGSAPNLQAASPGLIDDLTDDATDSIMGLTFGGFHYNDPRQIYAQIHYRFGY